MLTLQNVKFEMSEYSNRTINYNRNYNSQCDGLGQWKNIFGLTNETAIATAVVHLGTKIDNA